MADSVQWFTNDDDDAIKLRYDWPIYDIPSTCVCRDRFTVDHAMICKRFWKPRRAVFFDVRVCHPNADLARSIVTMRMRRRGHTHVEFLKLNTKPLHP